MHRKNTTYALMALLFGGCAPGSAEDASFGTSPTSSSGSTGSGVRVPGGTGDGTTSGPEPGSSEDIGGGESSGSDSGSSTGEIEPLAAGCDEATVSTAALGWVAGDEVGAQLGELLAGAAYGDVICLDERYDLRPADAPYVIPAGVTLAARLEGGLRVLDVLDIPNEGLFVLEDDVALSNLSITDEGELFGDDAAQFNNRVLFRSRETTGLVVYDCRFDAYAKTLMRLDDVSAFTIEGTHFANAYYQLSITGTSHDGSIGRSLFEHAVADGIKTGHRNASDVHDIHVDECAFEHNLRDGIDTTGGFRNSVVERTLFLDLFAGLDIKTVYEQDIDTHPPSNNRDITIRDCDFIDPGTGAIVLTTLDRVEFMTDENAPEKLTQAITVQDSIVEQRDRESRAMLIKDAHTVLWDGLQLLGEASESRIFGLAEPGDYGNRPMLSMTNWDVQVQGVVTGPARAEPPQRPFETVGPR